MSDAPSTFGTLVLGGGVNGLATAWQLARLGAERVGLIERHRFGHDRGSSHGAGRITRTSYADPLYVRLMRYAHGEEWPRLARDSGAVLLHRCDGAFFGPAGGPFDDYRAAAEGSDADVELLDVAEARRRFPLFAFPDAAGVLQDHTAAVVAAAATLRALVKQCSIEGVYPLEDTEVRSIDTSGDPIAVHTARGTLYTERLVITAGAWTARFVPALATRLHVKRQHVGYFRIAAPLAATQPGAFPVWIHTGVDARSGTYGLPAFEAPGIKAARHLVGGGADDPDDRPPVDAALLEDVRRFLNEQLTVPVEAAVHGETCLYTNTDDEDFVLAPLPGDARVVVGSACSGHGFKFGPLTGRLLAELSMHGRTSVPEFEAARARFAIL